MKLNFFSLIALSACIAAGMLVFDKTRCLWDVTAFSFVVRVLLSAGAAIALLKVIVWIRWKIHIWRK